MSGKQTDDQEFRQVFHEEMDQWIVERRKVESPPTNTQRDQVEITKEDTEGNEQVEVQERYLPKVDHGLFGLALSGGGVRSATYSLGVVQRLSKRGVLRYVDFLSTASGGGYLGSAWNSLTSSSPSFGSGPGNFPFKFIDDSAHRDRQIYDRESAAVRHIRAHGNWVAPHLGLFDVWTWTAITRYLTSTVLNLVLIPLPWVLVAFGLTMLAPNSWWDRAHPLAPPMGYFMLIGPVLLLSFAVFMWWRYPDLNVPGPHFKGPFYRLGRGILIAAVAFVLADGFILAIGLANAAFPSVAAWVAGLSPTGLVVTVGVIARFFTGDVQGGVSGGAGGRSKRLIGLLVSIVGYLALGLFLVSGYVLMDRWIFWEESGAGPTAIEAQIKSEPIRIQLPTTPLAQPDIRIVPMEVAITSESTTVSERVDIYESNLDGFTSWDWDINDISRLNVLVIVVGTAGAVAIAMLAMPWVQGFLNRFSLGNLNLRGLRKAYILELDPRDKDQVVTRGKRDILLRRLKREKEKPPDIPYHMITTSLNTSGDEDLDRLSRKSDGMVLAHLYSGSRTTGYRKTKDDPAFKEMTLGQATSISGAAASPNMGRATTTSMAILLALFNVRIGTWILNPDKEHTKPGSWRPLAWYWMKELFGKASARDRYVYLTDAGHFDNSGMYELLKRRCKYIAAIDASADIGNLATVARLARIDFGIQIDVDMAPFMPDRETGRSRRPYVVGKIKYPPVEVYRPDTWWTGIRGHGGHF